MDYRNAKQEMALLFPNTSIATDPNQVAAEDARSASASIGFARIARKVASVAHAIMDLPRRRAVQNELRMLSDRELADIGLSRSDVAHIYDVEFAAAQEAKVATFAVSPRRTTA